MPNVRILDEESSDEHEPPEDFSFTTPNGGPEELPDFSYLFKTPDLSSFVKVPKTAVAREYEKKTAALLKAGMVGAINMGQFPDAATFIAHGPAFSAATGALADADDRAKAVVDFLTTPANPYALFLITALPMVSQLLRNHERELAAAPVAFRTRKERKAKRKQEQAETPRVTVSIPFIGKQIKLGIRARFPVGKIFMGLRARSLDPRDLTVKVFSDPKIVEYLRRQGVNLSPPGDG